MRDSRIRMAKFVQVPTWVIHHPTVRESPGRLTTYVGLRLVAWEHEDRPWRSEAELAAVVGQAVGLGQSAVVKHLRALRSEGIIGGGHGEIFIPSDEPTDARNADESVEIRPRSVEIRPPSVEIRPRSAPYTYNCKKEEEITAAGPERGLDDDLLPVGSEWVNLPLPDVIGALAPLHCQPDEAARETPYDSSGVQTLVTARNLLVFIDRNGNRLGTRSRPNKYPGSCSTCGTAVPAGEGIMTGGKVMCTTSTGWYLADGNLNRWF